jgi:4-amino-4-deoxy-L-arabinose transferase-like glycosyltransferase
VNRRLAAAFPEIARTACDLAAFLIPAIAYVAAVSHEPASWDTAELQGVPYILGITHPTGFPLYVLLGWLWSHVLPFGSIAFRTNAMSAVTMAAAVAAAYAIAVELGTRRPVALLAALWFAFTQTIFAHAIRAEAHDLALALSAFSVYAIVRWLKGGASAWFAAAFAAYGLALAAHPNAIWLLPGLVLAAILAKRRPTWRLVAGSAALVVGGLAFYLYVPLRSAYIESHGLDPTGVLYGMALAGAGAAIFWNYNAPNTWTGLLRELTGSESSTPHVFVSSFDPSHWQAALWALIKGTNDQYGAFALVVAAFGIALMWKRDWRIALVLFVACSAALLFAVTYVAEGDTDRYRMLSLWMIAPLMALAAPRGNDIGNGLGRFVLCIFLAVGAGTAFWAGHGFYRHAPREGGRWVIDRVAQSTPQGSIVVADWMDATSLAYGAYADGSLPNRIIVSGWEPTHVGLYRSWVAPGRRVFLLVNPRDSDGLPNGTRFYRKLDDFHALYEALRF